MWYAQALESEIEIWSGLLHDHIVPFYGASTLTSPPYIVSRYMSNGNLVQYLSRKPNVDRLKLVCPDGYGGFNLSLRLNAKIFEVSLGMFHLHGEYIIHGDLKGVSAVCCDIAHLTHMIIGKCAYR